MSAMGRMAPRCEASCCPSGGMKSFMAPAVSAFGAGANVDVRVDFDLPNDDFPLRVEELKRLVLFNFNLSIVFL